MEIDYNITELESVTTKLLEQINSRIVLFHGEMGVGKTTLIKAMVKSLGSTDDVTSPTFSIVNEYESKNGSIFHFDMYRIEDEMEALNFGFEDYFNNDNNWLFIEWPEKVSNLLPEDVCEITIKDNNKISRTLKLSQNELLTKKPAYELC
ncbi:tRNA (adenosine(37)-N6)-threonylcarbamoyltransferase complex ATPase subunit type 1 TsaE [Psychroserpens ponticola]|uniref:tRNA threonylcarbamoyladenosine biosynthesis protein TsaE n=1 Tax=Psychroserpens ponticola TaxID=2932268 RepID=A0ABY7S1F0_9FLAO|nr:tRNA (adenosine(37)-N6)-threonylcarbamoyltransferase complex ATPase subunit type 1 TsaE [Psychroserpens ponticola]WCO03112.1 tRNA (adenosine(37)-N6)-threonylcarbamoyltransferase complex ATPase subunit type 1 TsaE [Psychroserpens ponticola]